MNATARLLRAASEILGGDPALARYLGIHEAVLLRLFEDPSTIPDAVLLRTIDLIQGDYEGRPMSGLAQAGPPPS